MTVSSMPSESGRVLRALIQKGKPLIVAETQAVLGPRHHDTAKQVMAELGQGVVLEYVERGEGGVAVLRFRPEWDWCASKEFRDLLLG